MIPAKNGRWVIGLWAVYFLPFLILAPMSADNSAWLWPFLGQAMLLCLSLAWVSLFIRTARRQMAALLFGALLLIPNYIALITGQHVSTSMMYRAIVWVGLLNALWAYFLEADISPRRRRVGQLTLLSVMVALILPFVIYFAIAGRAITSDVVLAILQTDKGETNEYMGRHLARILLMVVPPVAASAVLFWRFLRHHDADDAPAMRAVPASPLAALAIGLLTAAALMYSADHKNPYISYAIQAENSLDEYVRFTETSRDREQRLAHLNVSGLKPGNYYLVIGESQNKAHMSAYGYARETTPWLKSRRSDAHFIFFEKAYASYTHTVQALTYALTAKNQYRKLALERAPSILDVFEAAGGKTYWLSNQSPAGAFDTPLSVIARSADYRVWTYLPETGVHSYDGELIEALRHLKTDPDKPNLIVLHMIGTHEGYDKRYPRRGVPFAVETPVDDYDNAMHYNDRVVQALFEQMQHDPAFMTMVFMSDHGEAVDEGRGHDSSRFCFPMARIPFYVAVSPAFAARDPSLIKALRAHQNRVFTNDLLFNLLCGLTGIDLQQYDDKTLDPSSPAYGLKASQATTLYGRRPITDDPAFVP